MSRLKNSVLSTRHDFFMKIWFACVALMFTFVMFIVVSVLVISVKMIDAIQTDGLKHVIEQIWEGDTSNRVQ